MTKERIRVQMSINPSSKLWDKDFKKWDESDKAEFTEMENGKIIAKVIHKKPVNSIKVIRVYDGKIYLSITDCRLSNGLCKTTILKLLKENKLFKRL